jgi:hypothetical protein
MVLQCSVHQSGALLPPVTAPSGGESRLWCCKVTVMVLESNGYGVREQRSWYFSVTV